MTRRWLVTGAGGGIGNAIAQAVLDRGETVVGTFRDPAQIAAFEAIAPGRATGILADLAHHEAIGATIGGLGRFDIAVNNAARSLFGAVEETSIDEARDLFAVNLLGPLAIIQAVLPAMRAARSGTIVNLSSGCGFSATAGLGLYSASKFALEGLSEAVAAETRSFGIRVVVVEPGAIATKFIRTGTAEVTTRIPDYQPLSGLGKSALEAYYTNGAAPASSIAAAILDALDMPELPFRLPVGSIVRDALRAKGDQLSSTALAQAGWR